MPVSREHYLSVRNHFLHLLHERCCYCGSNENLELDHIIPSLEGEGRGQERRMWGWFKEYAENNLQILCGNCNRKKSSKGKKRKNQR